MADPALAGRWDVVATVGDETPFGRRRAAPDRAASPVAEVEPGNIDAVSTKPNDAFVCASAHDNFVPPPPGTPGL